MQDTLYIGQEARGGIISGIRKCADAVGVTMGTGGSNSIIEAVESPGYATTNDGYTILNAIRFNDPLEELGRRILLEAVNRANKASGDGSSTTCVLTAAIIEEGLKHLKEMSPMELKKSLEECIETIEERINVQTRQISVDEVGAVASISAEDPEIGARIQEIYQKIGKDGIVHWDVSKTPEDYYEIGQGITVHGAGFFTPYMCDADESGQNTNRIRLKDPKILITKQKITSAADFNDIGQKLFDDNVKDLVVFCDEIDPLVITDLIKTRMVRGFRFIIVKMPTLWKDWWYVDLAKATGATVIDPIALPMKDLTKEHLGSVGFINITKDETHLDGIQDVSEHIKELAADGSDDAKLRISRLNTKTARYFVGAYSENALAHRRFKVEDAISAAYQALQGGIVLGGGCPLAKIAEEIKSPILQVALKAPKAQIVKNMGKEYSEEDMEKGQVFDPATIVKNACKNAISVAATALTAPTIILLPREETPRQV